MPTATQKPTLPCLSWCEDAGQDWSSKCTWDSSCAGCEACTHQPTALPTPEPTSTYAPTCNECDDIPTDDMISNNITCAEAPEQSWWIELVTAQPLYCANDNTWTTNRYCSHTCYVSGAGYDGDACCIEQGPSVAPTPRATPSQWRFEDFKSADEIRDVLVEKHGLVCYSCDRDKFEQFTDTVSWAYNYRLYPHDEKDWYNAHLKEFVPMLSHSVNKKWEFDQQLPNGYQTEFEDGECYMHRQPKCAFQDFVDILNASKQELLVPMQYIFGANEAWDNTSSKRALKWISPTDMAEIWAEYMMPISELFDLKLISPTFGYHDKHCEWFVDFLKACWDLRNASTPCDVETIDTFSVHYYQCPQHDHLKYFGYNDTSDSHNVKRQVLTMLDGYGGKDWTSWYNQRRYWMTEVNCNHEDGAKWPGGMDPVESCQIISGNRSETHGIGPFRTLLRMDEVARFNWWNTWNDATTNTGTSSQRTLDARMIDNDNMVLPPGKAIASMTFPTEFGTDCSYDPFHFGPSHAPTVSPAPSAQPTTAPPCESWCSSNSNDWSSKCGWSACSGCDECAQDDDDGGSSTADAASTSIVVTTAVAGAAAIAAAAGYAYKHSRKSPHLRPNHVTIELKDGQVTRAQVPAGTEVSIVVSASETENPIVSDL